MYCKIRVTCLTCKSRFELTSGHFQPGKCACPSCKAILPERYTEAIYEMMSAASDLPDRPMGWEGEQKFLFACVTDDPQDTL